MPARTSSTGVRGATIPLTEALRVRRRQGLTVHLAVGSEGQRRQGHEGGRQHVVRQPVPQGLAHRIDRGVADHVGDQPLLAGEHDRLADSGLRGQHRLDLSQLDAEATHLDLMIDPPQDLHPSAGQVTGQVSRPVEASTRLSRVGVRQEALGRQIRPAEVAPRQARAADPELAGYSGRHALEPAVEQVDPGGRDRPADRDRTGLAGPDARGGRPDRGLGGAVEIPQLAVCARRETRRGRGAAPRRHRAPAGWDRRSSPTSRSIRQVAGVALQHAGPGSAKPGRQERAVRGLLPTSQHDAAAAQSGGERSPAPRCRS